MPLHCNCGETSDKCRVRECVVHPECALRPDRALVLVEFVRCSHSHLFNGTATGLASLARLPCLGTEAELRELEAAESIICANRSMCL